MIYLFVCVLMQPIEDKRVCTIMYWYWVVSEKKKCFYTNSGYDTTDIGAMIVFSSSGLCLNTSPLNYDNMIV